MFDVMTELNHQFSAKPFRKKDMIAFLDLADTRLADKFWKVLRQEKVQQNKSKKFVLVNFMKKTLSVFKRKAA